MHKKVRERLNLNFLIDYIYYNYMKMSFALALACLPYLKDEETRTFGNQIALIFSLFWTFGIPYIFGLIMCRNIDSLRFKETRDKFGSLYKFLKVQYATKHWSVPESIPYKTLNKLVVLNPLAFCMRKTAFVIITI